MLGAEFTEIFLGTKWIPMVPAMRVLALAGLVGSITATTRPIFHGIGKPRVDTIWQVVRLLVLIAVIYPLSMRWDIAGVAVAVLVSTFFSGIGFNLTTIRITKCGIYNFGKMTMLPLINASIMIFVIMALKTVFDHINFWQFLLLVGAGFISYLFIAYLFEKLVNYGMTKIIREIFLSI